MAKWIIPILIMFLLPYVMAATEIQYSEDNLTWINVTSVDEDENEGYQLNLQQDTLYFFRGRTDAGDWIYTSQRTKEGVFSMSIILAGVLGVGALVALFLILTIISARDKPFLANFYFLATFIFATVLSNLIWKVANVNSSPYEPIMFIVYRIMLIITMLMIFIVLTLVTIDAVQLRKWKGNPVDTYRDNLKENE